MLLAKNTDRQIQRHRRPIFVGLRGRFACTRQYAANADAADAAHDAAATADAADSRRQHLDGCADCCGNIERRRARDRGGRVTQHVELVRADAAHRIVARHRAIADYARMQFCGGCRGGKRRAAERRLRLKWRARMQTAAIDRTLTFAG